MSAYSRLTTHSHSSHASDQAPDYQLEVKVPGMIGIVGVGARFVADDSLAIRKMHRVGLLTTISIPVPSSMLNNCTVLGVENETQEFLILYVIPDLDLFNLNLWLADFIGPPVVV